MWNVVHLRPGQRLELATLRLELQLQLQFLWQHSQPLHVQPSNSWVLLFVWSFFFLFCVFAATAGRPFPSNFPRLRWLLR